MSKETDVLTCCPTCGAKLENSGTLVDLDANFIMHNDKVTFVTSHLAELLFMLWKRMPAVVSKESLIAGMYGAGDEPAGSGNIIAVYVTKANQRIASLGLVIENTWGKGYALRVKKQDEAAA